MVPETKLGKGCGNLIAFIRLTDTQWKKKASFFEHFGSEKAGEVLVCPEACLVCLGFFAVSV